jgi:hypothetical protein
MAGPFEAPAARGAKAVPGAYNVCDSGRAPSVGANRHHTIAQLGALGVFFVASANAHNIPHVNLFGLFGIFEERLIDIAKQSKDYIKWVMIYLEYFNGMAHIYFGIARQLRYPVRSPTRASRSGPRRLFSGRMH